jgi:hypothetical protein
LLKPQTLFSLPSGDREIFNLLERLRTGTQELPPGCEVTYELEAVEILKSLLRRSAGQVDALDRYYRDFRVLHGMRPTAVEVYQDGYNPRAVRERAGSWTGFVASMEDLTNEQRRALENFIGQFRIVEGARQNERAHDARYRRECLSRRAAADRPAIGSVQ